MGARTVMMSSSCSSNVLRNLTRNVYDEIERCRHCDMQISKDYYVVRNNNQVFCDEKCFRNFLVARADDIHKGYCEQMDIANLLKNEKEEIAGAIDVLNETNKQLSEKVEDLKKEIRIRNDDLDKFTLLDFD